MSDPTPSTLDAGTLGERLAIARVGAVDPVQRELARASVRASMLDEPPQRMQLGRYVLLERIGTGGMGAVYAAWDPELDRKVALKVLHGAASLRVVQKQSLLAAEAKSLAKLSHPNVVAVFDVGTFTADDGEAMFVAMEYVDGVTLARWMSEPHTVDDVIAVMIAAGRGLAAAHEVGIVHRDFKPDNVMLSAGDRVRVMDFGLAASVEVTPSGERGAAGTPAYMAPEQFLTGDVGPAADQFAFAVVFWEAVFRARPFAGETVAAICSAVLDGERAAPPSDANAPRWLRDVLERALSGMAAQRWPSMAELLVALEHGRGRARRRKIAIAVAASGVLAIGIASARALDERRRIAACEAEGSAIAEVWNDDARSRIRTAISATNVSYAAATADAVSPWIDEAAVAWQRARVESCMDARVHASWSEDLYQRGTWCLELRRLEIAALIDQLAEADADAVSFAISAASSLSPASGCRDADVLARQPSLPHDRAASIRDLRGQLVHAHTLRLAGRYAEGRDAAHELLAPAEEIAWPPLTAAIRLEEARALERLGALADAEALAVQAYFDAAAVDAWEVSSDAATLLIHITGIAAKRRADGLMWDRHAELASLHAGDPSGIHELDRRFHLAGVYYTAGEYTQARDVWEETLAIEERLRGADHPEAGAVVGHLSLVYAALGDFERARELSERALAIAIATVGPDHPETATALEQLGNVPWAAGDYLEARQKYERALAIRERALGPDHPEVAVALVNVANTYAIAGEPERALPLFERALAIEERRLGPDHPEVATTIGGLAAAHQDLGHSREAIALGLRAAALLERGLGASHPDLGIAFGNLGIAYSAVGEHERSRDAFDRALTIFEGALGPEHPQVAHTLSNLANEWRALGDRARAEPLARRAVEIFEREPGTQNGEDEARAVLARVLDKRDAAREAGRHR